MSTLLSTPGQVTMGGMVGSNASVNILKPVNIVNLGNTLRCGVGKREWYKRSKPPILNLLQSIKA